MSELIVTCPNGETQESERVVGGIVNIIAEYLRARSASGSWEIELFRKTGGGGQERIVFKRRHSVHGRKQALLFQVRPFDRSSSWRVLVHSPPGVDINEFLDTDPVATEPEPVPDVSEICNNQVHSATVTSHQAHGFDVQIKVKDEKIPGFVSLADLEEYDQKSLNKYPVGKNIKVVVCDASKFPVTCSTRVNAVLSTTNSNDFFTGTPNKDGSLSLKSFTRDYKRVYDLLQDLIIDMMGSRNNFIRKQRAVERATEHLKSKYGATTIDFRSVPLILNNLCSALESIPLPVLRHENDGVGDGYALTDFAWGELGGMDNLLLDKKENPPESEAELIHESAVSGNELEPESLEPESPVAEDSEREEIDESLDDVSGRIDGAAAYFGVICRLNEVSSQISTLQAEQGKLQKWVDKNKSLKDTLLQLQHLFSSVSKKRVQELTKDVDEPGLEPDEPGLEPVPVR